MKNLDKMMNEIDKTVDKKFGLTSKKLLKHFTIFSVALISVLFIIFLVKTAKDKPYQLAAIIESDLKIIEESLNKIDKECNILGFNYDNVRVDFLNVKAFSGSSVGCINLAYPKKWQGPYVPRNPTLQGKFYEIIRAKDGIYLTPGMGITLPNGLVMGQDVKITPDTKISELISSGGPLNYNGKSLVIKIKFKIGDWDGILTQTTTVDKINSALKEFNEAISLTQSETNTKVA